MPRCSPLYDREANAKMTDLQDAAQGGAAMMGERWGGNGAVVGGFFAKFRDCAADMAHLPLAATGLRWQRAILYFA